MDYYARWDVRVDGSGIAPAPEKQAFCTFLAKGAVHEDHG